MLSLLLPKTILGIDSIWFLTISLMALAIIMLAVASQKLSKDTLSYDIVKDVAIAFLAAAIVTITYDSVLDFRRVSDLFSLIVGDDVRPEVLDATKTQIFKREVLRENAELRFKIRQDNTLPAHQAIIELEIGYDLYGLKPEDFKFTVQQELEHYYLRNEAKNLPRFDSVTVGDKLYKDDELKGMIDKGLLTLKDVTVKPWPRREDAQTKQNSAVRIVTERTELVYIPGSYNIVFSHLTKGVRVYIDAPPNIEHNLKQWFDRGGKDFQPAGKYHIFDGIILPGQSLSLNFKLVDKPATPAPKSPSSM
jgi:hypothetical protein